MRFASRNNDPVELASFVEERTHAFLIAEVDRKSVIASAGFDDLVVGAQLPNHRLAQRPRRPYDHDFLHARTLRSRATLAHAVEQCTDVFLEELTVA